MARGKSGKHSQVDYLNTVTSLSKVVTAILFIALPFIGFLLGVAYQRGQTTPPSVYSQY
jgi:hypothetical protein